MMISVCMTTYNGERYLDEQIESILTCLGESDELIVSDDGSTDRTVRILADYAAKDRRIRLTNGPGRGVVSNFSHVISLADGDYIFLSDQDDIWKDNKVSKVVETFNSSGCMLVTHNARLIDGIGNDMGMTLFKLRNSMPGFLKNFTKNSYVGCCMAFRKDLVSSILPIPETVEMHDWWIGLIAEKISSPVFIPDELIDYRRHNENISSLSHYSVGRMLSNRLTLLREVSGRLSDLKVMMV